MTSWIEDAGWRGVIPLNTRPQLPDPQPKPVHLRSAVVHLSMSLTMRLIAAPQVSGNE